MRLVEFRQPPPGDIQWYYVKLRVIEGENILPGTQMTLFLSGKGLLLEVSTPKIEDKQVPGTLYMLPTTFNWNQQQKTSTAEIGGPLILKILLLAA